MFARRCKTRDVETDAATQSRWLGPGAKAVALTVLLLAAVVTERNRTHEEIKQVCAQLTMMVAQMKQYSTAYPWVPPDDDGGPAPKGRRRNR